MKKKILLIMLSVLFVLSTVIASGCGHKHSFNEQVVEPTCAERGYKKKVCECGEEEILEDSYVDVLEHSYNNGKCKACEISLFDGDYQELSLKAATDFVSDLDVNSTKINWIDGYVVKSSTDFTYDELPEKLENVYNGSVSLKLTRRIKTEK